MDYEANLTAEQKDVAKDVIKMIGVDGLTINELFSGIAEYVGNYGAKIEIEAKQATKVTEMNMI